MLVDLGRNRLRIGCSTNFSSCPATFAKFSFVPGRFAQTVEHAKFKSTHPSQRTGGTLCTVPYSRSNLGFRRRLVAVVGLSSSSLLGAETEEGRRAREVGEERERVSSPSPLSSVDDTWWDEWFLYHIHIHTTKRDSGMDIHHDTSMRAGKEVAYILSPSNRAFLPQCQKRGCSSVCSCARNQKLES